MQRIAHSLLYLSNMGGFYDQKITKFDLAQEMLEDVREILPLTRLWVAMDRWFLSKSRDLLVQKANLFVGKKNEFLAVPIPDVYMKMPKVTTGKNGKQYTKHVFTPIAAIAICRLPEDILTHGQVIQGLIIASVWIEHVPHQGKTRILVKFDTTSDMFSRIILRLWPDNFQLLPWPNCNLLPATA